MTIVPISSVPVRANDVTESWQRAIKDAFRDPEQLVRYLGLADSWIPNAKRAAETFPLFAPREFVDRMERSNPYDPLLRQVLPLAEELTETAGFHQDPVGDRRSVVRPGLIQKYRGRALMVATGSCAVHCRYCFRRHFPYSEGPTGIEQWDPTLAAIEQDDSIDELILSGGDPLMLTNTVLTELVRRLEQIVHLRRLRIHTRLPIMVPQRMDLPLLRLLTESRPTTIIVVHCNHPRELDKQVVDTIARCIDAGIPVLNQAVLLKGVNDSEQVLEQLCRELVNVRVMPYYLHQLDRVIGAAHFEVPMKRGLELVRSLEKNLPGYAVPRYVREIAGEAHKVTISSAIG